MSSRRGSTHSTYSAIFYRTGLILLVIAIIFGQLIWVFDPWRFGGLYLIDYIPQLIAACAVIPLLWTIGAVHACLRERRGKLSWLLIAVRVIMIIASLTAVYTLWTNPRQLLQLGLSFAAALAAVWADLIITDGLERRAFPRKGVSWSISSTVILALLLWPTNYLVTYPGITMNMQRYVQVDDGHPQGEIAGVLIFQRPAFPVDWLYAAIFPHYTFEKQEELGMPLDQYNQIVRRMKHDANTIAAAIALEKAGLGRGVIHIGVLVVDVVKDGPSEGVLQPGDLIVGANDVEVHRTDELMQVISGLEPGDPLEVVVVREGETRHLTLRTAAREDDPTRPMAGIQITDEVVYDVPLDIQFTQYLLHEGGPSHGGVLTLTIIDQLTPGGVTQGNYVAATGTIRADGSIGPIGGIRQKAFTVARSGVDVFFVPAGQEEEARLGAKDLQIVPVQTIDEILEWLAQHAKQTEDG